ncbi:serine peptidase [Comamonas serinivorans]|uniref:Probable periplasmic serine endoprotease DegP-like n=1 Tax=Comamonas serinivorans TaxID=1082851 RepID=A0A1Y0ESH1_9BURK|nr:DegQ family serine endoprotease [Comamonas serinivorans]ARU06625.1 serine peptidase [Comamonas serinivorans]
MTALFRVRASVGASVLALAALGAGGAQPALAQSAPQARGLPDFTELADQVGPAVVNIRTSAKRRALSPQDEQMQELLRRFFGGNLPDRSGDSEPVRGLGSGFITSADGYVMTNAHVVEGADEVTVTLTDKREFKAKVVGADKRTDIALLKIDATGLPIVKIGDVGKVKVGEWVMAIGSPFGLDNSVTAGIVSARQRDTGDYLPFIQTDVAINPGNSGGPLINLRGEVIGVNSQIYSRSGGFMGISFAIPIDEASRVAEQLRTTGKVTRGRIGVQIDAVTEDVAEAIGLGKARGALVRRIEPGSPAAKAGLEPGDVIVKLNQTDIERVNDLPRLVGALKPGSSATLSIVRRGQAKALPIQIAAVEPDKPAQPAGGKASEAQPARQLLGFGVSNMTDAQRRELGVRGGVLVERATGQAATAGAKAGDVVLAVDNKDVQSVAEFEAAMQAAAKRKKPFNLLVRRGDLAQYLVFKPAP